MTYVTAYFAAKHAFVSFTARWLSGSHARRSRCTPSVRRHWDRHRRLRTSEHHRQDRPLARGGAAEPGLPQLQIRPEEVAETVAWVCGGAAASVTARASSPPA